MNNKIPRTLPDCDLLQLLAEKAEQRQDVDFDFLGKLDDFQRRVSGEVRQINVLFPEYTPHDEQYHLKRLFHVACTVLGRGRLEVMNSAELFVLAVALYGHDWGMAVSDTEKQYIVTDKLPEGAKAEDLWILSNEQQRFAEFAHKQRLTADSDGHLAEIPIENWREYVRQTHAARSAVRVRRFFEPIDRGVAEAASRICEAHWLPFEDLQQYNSYPPNFAVLREAVNLRALAVYLRLADLLDLAEDRTPYIIWKFVAPRDPRSKLEWAKHRALQPVTCPPYQEGRIIVVDGSTDDHEVYAALEDLRIYCEEQLRGCNDLLARMNDPRHRLDLYHIDWRVMARGFKPVLIQFEFDRERMFEILGDEIYQGDSYVFLRELLQNSIDAIRMRREILQRKGIAPGNLGAIRVKVEHRDRGDAIVTWTDDGIGMDEYIVRNYLAVAGKSYYRSPDFERQGLKLDPISRFGIGVLSCFIVADHIQIETFKDPYLPPPGEPLRIDIPAMRRQFRIEVGPRESAQIGSTFRVHIDGRKLPIDDKDQSVKPLDVTGYLSIIAGFVEFPIVITEGDRKTIILHPEQDADTARQRFGKDYQVRQLDLRYPWSAVFPPQDLPAAREFLREQAYDLSSNMEGYQGTLTYLVPANNQLSLSTSDRGYGDEGGSILVGKREAECPMKRVRWLSGWGERGNRDAVGISRSANHPPSCAVYRDGILLATASPPNAESTLRELGLWSYSAGLPLPRLVVNLPKSKVPKVDLARTRILGESEHWAVPILRAHRHHLSETQLKDLLALDLSERLYRLATLTLQPVITSKSLADVLPKECWPLVCLETGGRLVVLEWRDVASDIIGLAPDGLENELIGMARCHWITRDHYQGFLSQWIGERCFVPGFEVWRTMENSVSIGAIGRLWGPAMESHHLAGIRFVSPPWEGNPPLIQRIHCRVDLPETPPDIEATLEEMIKDPSWLNPINSSLLRQPRQSDYLVVSALPDIFEFPAPFEKYFAYGVQAVNLKHPITQALVQIAAMTDLAKIRGSLSEVQIGSMRDALRALCESTRTEINDSRFTEAYGDEWERFCSGLERVWSLARELRLPGVYEIRSLIPTQEELVPGTLFRHDDGKTVLLSDFQVALQEKSEDIKPFGQPLV